MNAKEYLRDVRSGRRISQVGFFTDDIFAAMENWSNEHGISNWIFYPHNNNRLQNVIIKEGICEPEFQFYCACAPYGNLQIELIQPVYGLPFYENYLKEHGPGAHHIKEIVPEDKYDEVLEFYASQGMEVIFGAEFFGSRFYFINSIPKLDILLEIGNGKMPSGFPPEWGVPYPECLKYRDQNK